MKSIKKLIFVLIMALLVVCPLSVVNAAKKDKTTTETTTAVETKETTTKKSKKEKTTEAVKGEKVKFYIFYGDGCPHCQELHEYVADLQEDKSINYMFDVVDYEVWGNQTNYDLMVKVAKNFDFDVQGVPFYVIGDKYYSGFGDTSKKEITEVIKAFYSGESKYSDVVATIGTGESDVVEEEEDKTDSNLVGIIILAVVVVTIIILIIISSKSKDEDEEVVEADAKEVEKVEEVEEIKVEKPVKEEKKASKKKSTAKKTTTKKATLTKKKTSTKKK